uniref:Kazal-like domain-containing protein n=1 Tax=Graphocephala atropunctata TaxID=36148 RepID=A0A1B6M1L4_9HEMI
MRFHFLVVLLTGSVTAIAGMPGIFSSIRERLETWRACRCDCPVYFDAVCGFDHDNGYIVADNMCLMLRHNHCHKTNYVVVQKSICEGLPNSTKHFMPPLLIITKTLV